MCGPSVGSDSRAASARRASRIDPQPDTHARSGGCILPPCVSLPSVGSRGDARAYPAARQNFGSVVPGGCRARRVEEARVKQTRNAGQRETHPSRPAGDVMLRFTTDNLHHARVFALARRPGGRLQITEYQVAPPSACGYANPFQVSWRDGGILKFPHRRGHCRQSGGSSSCARP